MISVKGPVRIIKNRVWPGYYKNSPVNLPKTDHLWTFEAVQTKGVC